MSYLQNLEDQAIYIFREAFANFKNMAIALVNGQGFEYADLVGKEGFLREKSLSRWFISIRRMSFPEMLAFREWAKNITRLI